MPIALWIVGIVCVFALIYWLILRAPGSRRGVDSSDAVHQPSPTSPTTDEDALWLSVPERFVVFDLETTGLDPTRHEIIEIAAIKVNRDSDVHSYLQCLVKPLKRIPKRITRINGISQDMVNQDGEPLETVIKDFAEFAENLPLVSFNADFDMGFLQRSAEQHGIVIRNRVSCALKMARRAWPGRESYRLCDLAKDGHLPLEGMHRALEDCRRTIFIYTLAARTLEAKRRERSRAPRKRARAHNA